MPPRKRSWMSFPQRWKVIQLEQAQSNGFDHLLADSTMGSLNLLAACASQQSVSGLMNSRTVISPHPRRHLHQRRLRSLPSQLPKLRLRRERKETMTTETPAFATVHRPTGDVLSVYLGAEMKGQWLTFCAANNTTSSEAMRNVVRKLTNRVAHEPRTFQIGLEQPDLGRRG